MASPNAAYPELVATTFRHAHKNGEVIDNFTNHNALMRWMKEEGNVKTDDANGGTELTCNLAYAQNSTYQRYSRLDVLDIGQTEVITAAKYDWSQAAIHVITDGYEMRVNKGPARIKKLAKEKVKVAIGTAVNEQSVDLYSDGALSNQIGGLAHIIQADGQGTVGGIDSSVYTFWRNKFQEMSDPTSFAALKADMLNLWLQTKRGMDESKLINLTHDLYAVYENGLTDYQRYANGDQAGKYGFTSLQYKSASVMFDDNTNFGTTAEIGYFVNPKYLHFCEHPDAKWTEEEAKRPLNQDAIVVPMLWQGQLLCDNRARQGRLVDAA